MDACLSENVVAALVSGSLSRLEIEAAERHLDGCVICRELVAQALRAPAPADVARVERIGRYRVIREVGSGGMGRVYAAEDPDLGREVAIKILHPVGHDEIDGRRARLAREARAMARLAHPNVITVYEVGAAGETLFIAMELVKGSTLGRWLANAPRDVRAIADVMRAAGHGLAAAHAAGIIHRDFKPDNVLVGDDGRVRVTDFGLAHLSALEASLPASPAATAPGGTLTASGALVGTPAYMALEQLRGDVADERSDLFSFCVTFWEALYGERPYAGRDLAELHAAVTAGRLRPPPEGRAVPRPLHDAIRRGLQPSRGDRPASMAALLTAIDAAFALDAPVARATSNRLLWIAVGALAGIAAATGIALSRNAESVPRSPGPIAAQPSHAAPHVDAPPLPPLASLMSATLDLPPIPPVVPAASPGPITSGAKPASAATPPRDPPLRRKISAPEPAVSRAPTGSAAPAEPRPVAPPQPPSSDPLEDQR
ncbi:Serine/threonine kinase PKN8 [Minicystis rosea]|nr:Serine/threonine kinase PKN8 [Minicystis rosea]